MPDGPTPENWATLRSSRPQREDDLATLPVLSSGQETPLTLGMDQAGHLHLLIPAPRNENEVLPTDVNGLRVRHRTLATGPVLDLCAPPSHERVFTPFCREIVDAVATAGRDPWKAVAATIRAWRSAWNPLRQQMEKTTQVGLFGELFVLRTVMIPCLGVGAVDQWSGPRSERHDFVGERLHLEVKTTRKSRSEHEISRLDQLRCPPGCQLLFVSIQVEESVGGSDTLATELDAIVDLLRGNAAVLDDFMTKMVHVGWSDEMRTSGELVRFFLRRAEVFAVDDDFPRLPDNFEPPSGVVSVKYTVDLANLAALGLDEAIALIKEANLRHDS